MSDVNNNVVDFPMEDNTVKNKIFITIEGIEVQLNQADLDISFEATENEIMQRIVPIIQEEKGIDISDSYKVRKMINNENIFIIPASVAG